MGARRAPPRRPPPLLLLLMAPLLACLLLAPSVALASPTPAPVSDCWKALSYDLCTVQDASGGVCKSKFLQDQFNDAAYRRQLFDFLVERYLTLTVGKSIESVLAVAFSPSNTTYAAYLDGAYGTACATDADVQALLLAANTEELAILFRGLWLDLMKQAEHCDANEVWILDMGCVCKEEKDCKVLNGAQHASVFKAVALMVAILVVVILFAGVASTRQLWSIALSHAKIDSAIEYFSARVHSMKGGASAEHSSAAPAATRSFASSTSSAGASMNQRTTGGSSVSRSYAAPSRPTSQPASPTSRRLAQREYPELAAAAPQSYGPAFVGATSTVLPPQSQPPPPKSTFDS